VKLALKRGAIVVTAAGNSNEDGKLHAPSNIPGVISVAALNQSMGKANFSNTNTSLARPIAAPGVQILSLKTGGGYVAYSGTSMATPMVAGLIGVMRSLRPKLTRDQIYKILKETGVAGPDHDKVGMGINALKAIEAID